MKYTGIVIADIHVGAFDLKRQREEYLSILIDRIRNMDTLDFVIICGDFFDHKFFLNDKESTQAYSMLEELIITCKLKHALIRIVYGTESHECNQYDLLEVMSLYDNIRIIKEVEDEELLPDLKVLYLPEEHIYDKDKYYEEYFLKPKKYDYVFGHGIIREVMSEAVAHMSTTKKSKRKQVPIFSSGELSRICRGQVYFGHYHINKNINDKVFYVGSFSRWQFGQEEDKGYYIIHCNTDKHKYTNEFIVNTMAETYQTIKYGYKANIFNDEEVMNQTLNRMDELIDNHIYDHMRFIFNIPKDAENPESTLNYLKERYKFNDHIKMETVNGYVEEQKEQKKKQLKVENDKYEFIFDKSLPMEDKISQYVSLEYNRDIPPKKVNEYITNSLQEILSK